MVSDEIVNEAKAKVYMFIFNLYKKDVDTGFKKYKIMDISVFATTFFKL